MSGRGSCLEQAQVHGRVRKQNRIKSDSDGTEAPGDSDVPGADNVTTYARPRTGGNKLTNQNALLTHMTRKHSTTVTEVCVTHTDGQGRTEHFGKHNSSATCNQCVADRSFQDNTSTQVQTMPRNECQERKFNPHMKGVSLQNKEQSEIPSLEETISLSQGATALPQERNSIDGQKAEKNNQDLDENKEISIKIQVTSPADKRTTVLSQSCTVYEYVKWKLIVQNKHTLEQLSNLMSTNTKAEMMHNGTLEVISSVSESDEAMKDLGRKMIAEVLQWKGFSKQEVTVDTSVKELCQRIINESDLGIMKIIYAEVVDNQLFVVYYTRYQNKVSTLLDIIIHNRQESLKKELERFWLKLHSQAGLQSHLRKTTKYEDIDFNFETDGNKTLLTITGPIYVVYLALDELEKIRRQVRKKTIDINIQHKSALMEVFVEHVLDQHLLDLGRKCVSIQKHGMILLYGFDEDDLIQGCIDVNEMIIEDTVTLTKTQQRSAEGIRSDLIQQFGSCIAVTSEMKSGKLFIVGLKDSVKNAVEYVKNSDWREQHAFKFEMHDEELFNSFCKSPVRNHLAEDSNVVIEGKRESGKFYIIISGYENVEKVGKRVKRLVERGFVCDTASYRVTDGFCSAPTKRVMRSAADKNEVIIKQLTESSFSEEITEIDTCVTYPNGCQAEAIKWIAEGTGGIELTNEPGLKSVDSSTKIANIIFQDILPDGNNYRGRHVDGGIHIEVRELLWSDNSDEEYGGIWESLFSTIVKENDEHVVLVNVDSVKSYPRTKLIFSVVSQAVYYVLCRQTTKIKCFCFVVDEQEDFALLAEDTRGILRQLCKVDDSRKELTVSIVPGELNKIAVDVVVNTASRSLDLSKGTVSKILLREAGNELQAECWEKYPNGLKRCHVAITSGHRLPCDKVFHVALDKFDINTYKNSIQNIEKLVYLCLEEANEMKLRTIAFPALGTGKLRYPADLVATAMFGGVKAFQENVEDSSIRSVNFVVYHQDTEVLQEFRKLEQRDVSSFGPTDSEHQPKEVEFKFFGLSDPVKKAKEAVNEHMKSMLQDWHIGEKAMTEIEGVVRKDFLALCYLHQQLTDELVKTGVSIQHEKDKLVIKGKHGLIGETIEKIKDAVADVAKRKFVNGDVRNCNHQSIEKEMAIINENRQPVHCLYDKENEIVYFYGTPQTDLKKILNTFLTRVKEEQNVGHPVKEKGAEKQKRISNSCETVKEKHVSEKVSDRSDYEVQMSKLCSTSDTNESQKSSSELKKVKPKKECSSKLSAKGKSQDAITEPKSLKGITGTQFLIFIYQEDILQTRVDCIVNPANARLTHTGGLAYTIAKAGGKLVTKDSKKIIKSRGELPVSTVVHTTGFGLHKYLLHGVGPCWDDYDVSKPERIVACMEDLKTTIINCLRVADSLSMTSVALPTISSGAFRVPQEICATQYAAALLEMSGKCKSLSEIHFVDINSEMIPLLQFYFSEIIEKKNCMTVDVQQYVEELIPDRAGKKLKATGREKPQRVKDLEDRQSQSDARDNYIDYKEIDKCLTCTYGSRCTLLVYKADILQLAGIDAIVCSENSKGSGKDDLTKSLLQMAGSEYAAEKKCYFKNKRSQGEIVITKGGQTNFSFILHAVVSRKDDKILHTAYRNIFEETLCTGRLQSVALNLLRTEGNRATDTCVSASALFIEWLDVCRKNPDLKTSVKVYVIVDDETLAEDVKQRFKGFVDGSTDSSKHKPKDVVTCDAAKKATDGLTGSPKQNPKNSVTCDAAKKATDFSMDPPKQNQNDSVTCDAAKKATDGSTDSPKQNPKNSVTCDAAKKATDFSMDPPKLNPKDSLTRDAAKKANDGSTESPKQNPKDYLTRDAAKKANDGSADSPKQNPNESLTCDAAKKATGGSTDSPKRSVSKDYLTRDAAKEATDSASAVAKSLKAEQNDCVICMDTVAEAQELKCGHVFCKECIEGYFRVKKVCPTCGQVCGVIYGDQPDGRMEVFKSDYSLAGYKDCQTIGITYRFKDGIQGPEHPRPGTPYVGIARTAYLPDNVAGRKICAMLIKAFERRLVFTIGTSRTTGQEGVITWNDIHHKTDYRPNTQFGYPDETYLERVKEELEVKGVSADDIDARLLTDLRHKSYKHAFRGLSPHDRD